MSKSSLKLYRKCGHEPLQKLEKRECDVSETIARYLSYLAMKLREQQKLNKTKENAKWTWFSVHEYNECST